MGSETKEYRLTCVAGEHRGHSWPIGETPTLVGRGKDCHIVLSSALVSRRHCVLCVRGGGVALKDLGGRNPSLVNGMPCREKVLQPGDELALAQERFLISQGAASTEGGPGAPGHDTDRWAIPSPGDGAAPRDGLQDFARARTIDELAIQHDLALRLGNCESRAELLDRFLGHALSVFSAQLLWLGICTGDGDIILAGERGWDEIEDDDFPRAKARDICRGGKPFLATRETQFASRPVVLSSMAAPIFVMSQLIGVIIVESDCERRVYGHNDLHQLRLSAQTLAPFLKMATELQSLRRDYSLLAGRTGGATGMLGESAAMNRVRERLTAAGSSGLNVLIHGETGTGKELAARLVHETSTRAQEPFIVVNCAAIPEELFESEIFGHVEGAFTGAVHSRDGLLAEAHRGTLFLDEIGDLSRRNQARILRAIENLSFRPLGGSADRQVDVRFVAATNANLREAMESNEFRSDLYHRLSGIEIELPPLRQRREDIPLLLRHFVEIAAGEAGIAPPPIHPKALDAAMNHEWTGNVRELRNAALRAVNAAAGDGAVHPDDLGLGQSAASTAPAAGRCLTWEEIERRAIEDALRFSGGSIPLAAKALKIGRSSFYAKVRRYGIKT